MSKREPDSDAPFEEGAIYERTREVTLDLWHGGSTTARTLQIEGGDTYMGDTLPLRAFFPKMPSDTHGTKLRVTMIVEVVEAGSEPCPIRKWEDDYKQCTRKKEAKS